TQGRFQGWAAYTLAWNRRQFANINGGRWYPGPFDRRHAVTLTGQWRATDDVTLSATWDYHSGQPVTAPVAVREELGGDIGRGVLIYGDRNNFRMPAFHRLDVGASFAKERRKGRVRTWRVGFYNLYNRANPYFVDLRRALLFDRPWNNWSPNSGDPPPQEIGVNYRLVSRSALPILPYLSYHWSF
ncbi:MAG: hypothetical protein WBA12_16270, partial [Catalinimonas sp.]